MQIRSMLILGFSALLLSTSCQQNIGAPDCIEGGDAAFSIPLTENLEEVIRTDGIYIGPDNQVGKSSVVVFFQNGLYFTGQLADTADEQDMSHGDLLPSDPPIIALAGGRYLMQESTLHLEGYVPTFCGVNMEVSAGQYSTADDGLLIGDDLYTFQTVERKPNQDWILGLLAQ